VTLRYRPTVQGGRSVSSGEGVERPRVAARARSEGPRARSAWGSARGESALRPTRSVAFATRPKGGRFGGRHMTLRYRATVQGGRGVSSEQGPRAERGDATPEAERPATQWRVK
jgi:hypothetical protein